MDALRPDPLDRVRRSFDAIAEGCARQFADELAGKPFDRAILERLAGSLVAGAHVLDLGCGAAGHIGAFVQGLGAQVTGVDFSEASIAAARRVQPSLDFVVADFRALPFDDASVDGAVAFYCLIYGSDDDVVAALGEVRRVLVPGGRLLAAAHGAPDDRPYTEHFEDFDGLPVDINLRYTTPGVIASLAERAGLRVDEIVTRPPHEFEHPARRIYLLATSPER